MNTIVARKSRSVLFMAKLFFALSRTPHGLLDMTTPAMAALLWYGVFPPLKVVLLGIVTAFAGYTSVYALNDLVDYRVDREKMEQGGFHNTENYLDGILIRHPIASALLTFKEALFWALAWAFLTVIGAYLLNPFCVVIFLMAALLETIYCLLWRTTYLRTLFGGVVKTSGAMAAVYAIDPHPAPVFMAFLFLWLFFWEIGCQNIPADWTDIEEDGQLKAKTIPVCFGPVRANAVIMISVILSIVLNVVVLLLAQVKNPLMAIAASLCAAFYVLLIPAYKLYLTRTRADAMALFNRASYYPVIMLVIVSIDMLI